MSNFHVIEAAMVRPSVCVCVFMQCVAKYAIFRQSAFWEVRTFWPVLASSKSCWGVQLGSESVVGLGLGSGLV